MCPECVDSSARKSEYAAGIGVARKGEGAEDSKEKVQGFGSAFFLRIQIRIRAKILGVSGGGGWG